MTVLADNYWSNIIVKSSNIVTNRLLWHFSCSPTVTISDLYCTFSIWGTVQDRPRRPDEVFTHQIARDGKKQLFISAIVSVGAKWYQSHLRRMNNEDDISSIVETVTQWYSDKGLLWQFKKTIDPKVLQNVRILWQLTDCNTFAIPQQCLNISFLLYKQKSNVNATCVAKAGGLGNRRLLYPC